MSKKKEIKIPIAIFIIVLLIIIILGGSVFAYFFTDVFKSDEEMFFKYIAQNSELLNFFEDSDLESYKNKQGTTGYSNEGSLTMSYTGDDDIDSVLQNTSITFSGDTDKYANYKYETVSFNYSDTDSLIFRYINMDDYYGIKIDDVLKKYIALENNDLSSWLTELGLVDEEYASLIPDKIDLTEYEDIEIFTDEEKETLKEKYKSLLLENLSDESFSKSDTETGTMYTLTLTEEEQMQLVYNMLEQAKNDETIISGVKKLIIEVLDCTEEEATEYVNDIIEIINGLQEDIQDELSGTETDATTDDTSVDSTTSEDTVLDTSDSSTTTTSTDTNIYINVYVESKELTKTELIFGDEVSFAINKDDSSYSFELIELDSTDSTSIKAEVTKNKTDDNLEYMVSVSYQDENVMDCTINFNGIDTLNTVTESFTLAIKYDDTNIDYSYSDSKTFGTITEEEISIDDDMLFLNSTSNIDNITNLLTKVSDKLEEVDNEYTTNLGISESPITYYSPALIPFASMVLVENNLGLIGLGGGSVASVFGLYIYNQLNSTINEALIDYTTTDDEIEETDTDDSEETVTETSDDSTQAEAFNSSYENYVGTSLSVANIRAIYSLVIGNNETETSAGTNHIVTINGEQVESTPEDLTTDTTYTVTLEYDENGYVCNVIYKDNNVEDSDDTNTEENTTTNETTENTTDTSNSTSANTNTSSEWDY